MANFTIPGGSVSAQRGTVRDDIFRVGDLAALSANSVDGRGGFDTLVLDLGDFLFLGPLALGNPTNIEAIAFTGVGGIYFALSTLPAGFNHHLTIDGHAAAQGLQADLSALSVADSVTLIGGGADDYVLAGPGTTSITGGGGYNYYLLPAGRVTVTDFTPGQDTLDFTGSAYASEAQLLSRARQVGDDVRLAAPDGAKVLLQHMTLVQLAESAIFGLPALHLAPITLHIAEGRAWGATVGALPRIALPGDSLTWHLAPAAASAPFYLDGNILHAARPFDHATDTSFTVRLIATDSFGLTQQVAVNVVVDVTPATSLAVNKVVAQRGASGTDGPFLPDSAPGLNGANAPLPGEVGGATTGSAPTIAEGHTSVTGTGPADSLSYNLTANGGYGGSGSPGGSAQADQQIVPSGGDNYFWGHGGNSGGGAAGGAATVSLNQSQVAFNGGLQAVWSASLTSYAGGGGFGQMGGFGSVGGAGLSGGAAGTAHVEVVQNRIAASGRGELAVDVIAHANGGNGGNGGSGGDGANYEAAAGGATHGGDGGAGQNGGVATALIAGNSFITSGYGHVLLGGYAQGGWAGSGGPGGSGGFTLDGPSLGAIGPGEAGNSGQGGAGGNGGDAIFTITGNTIRFGNGNTALPAGVGPEAPQVTIFLTAEGGQAGTGGHGGRVFSDPHLTPATAGLNGHDGQVGSALVELTHNTIMLGSGTGRVLYVGLESVVHVGTGSAWSQAGSYDVDQNVFNGGGSGTLKLDINTNVTVDVGAGTLQVGSTGSNSLRGFSTFDASVDSVGAISFRDGAGDQTYILFTDHRNPGQDVVVMGGGGHDTVMNFIAGDLLDLHAIAGLHDLDGVLAATEATGAGALLHLSATDTVLFAGVAKSGLLANEFIFA